MEKKEKKIYCNCCGKAIGKEGTDKREDYLEVRKEWGYFSDKDGDIHHFILCESCYDQFIKQFCIPVEKTIQTELL